VTRYVCTAEDIVKEHPEAEMVPGSREERQVTEGGALRAGHIQRGPRGE
jgi:hypothetical protein